MIGNGYGPRCNRYPASRWPDLAALTMLQRGVQLHDTDEELAHELLSSAFPADSVRPELKFACDAVSRWMKSIALMRRLLNGHHGRASRDVFQLSLILAEDVNMCLYEEYKHLNLCETQIEDRKQIRDALSCITKSGSMIGPGYQSQYFHIDETSVLSGSEKGSALTRSQFILSMLSMKPRYSTSLDIRWAKAAVDLCGMVDVCESKHFYEMQDEGLKHDVNAFMHDACDVATNRIHWLIMQDAWLLDGER